MKFITYPCADITTAYLTNFDWDLIIAPAAPDHLANVDDGGSLFYLPDAT